MRARTQFASQVLVLDDAFQHQALARDVDLVMLDWSRPLGNGRMLPRGLLREPPRALRRADGLVFTRCSDEAMRRGGIPDGRLKGTVGARPVFHAAQNASVRRWVPAVASIGSRPGLHTAEGRSVWAFSGIARNPDFHRTLVQMGYRVVGCSTFRDHHRYRDGELHDIVQAATAVGAHMLATTEKDFCRLDPERQWPLDLAVLGVDPDLGSQQRRFEDFMIQRVQAALDRLGGKPRYPGRSAPGGQ
jgi:tetraacyldisaccharide 4'-kinase